MLERPLAGWQGSGDGVAWGGEVEADGGEEGEEIAAFGDGGGVFPVDCINLLACLFKLRGGRGGREGGKGGVLSMPLNPDASTSPFAERPKLSRVAAVEATAAKLRDPSPAPPMERMSCRCSCSSLRRMKEPKQPVAWSTRIWASAHSSDN
jgi:hypothetical protein